MPARPTSRPARRLTALVLLTLVAGSLPVATATAADPGPSASASATQSATPASSAPSDPGGPPFAPAPELPASTEQTAAAPTASPTAATAATSVPVPAQLHAPQAAPAAVGCPAPGGAPPGASSAVGGAGDLGNTYYFADTFTSQATTVIGYGRSNDVVFSGDWDGDGRDTLAVRREHYYYFKNSIAPGGADVTIAYGRRTDSVLAGDWDGDGKDTLAVRRGSAYYLSNCLAGGAANEVIIYGNPDDIVFVGDWNGDGKDTLAVRRGSTYYLLNSNPSGAADVVVAYGRPTDQVVVGDWNGDGKDTLAVRRGNTFYIKNSLTGGGADVTVPYGRPNDMVLTGDWNGDRRDSLGLRRPPDPPRPVVYTFDIAWAGQPNGYYCGPTSGFMILRFKGATRSAAGAPLTIGNVAAVMRTDAYGYTSFHDRRFERGMNEWLGHRRYTTLHTPSPATVREEVLDSFRNGYPVAVDEQERRGGPHFNNHSNSTFSHIMVVTGYNTQTDAVQFADPGATLWAGAAQKFWYPSLTTFTRTYLQVEYVNDGREHIGIFTA